MYTPLDSPPPMQEHLRLSKDCLVSIYQLLTLNIHFNSPLMHLPMLNRRGARGICGAADFFEEFLSNPTLESKKMVQIRSNLPTLETNCIKYQHILPCIYEFYYTLGTSSLPKIRCSFLSFIITDNNNNNNNKNFI